MNKKKINYWFLFFSGVAVSLFILPFLYALGVPSYDVILVSLFGENSILAMVFSLILIMIVLFSIGKWSTKL